MKKYFFLFIFIFGYISFSQDKLNCDWNVSKTYQNELNLQYGDKIKSPLKPKDLKKFKGLNFYDVSSDFCFIATLNLTPNEKPFEMQTTRGLIVLYVKYADISFEYQGNTYSLEAYRKVPKENEEAARYLFVPFTDLTSGNESYAGGRYLHFDIPTENKIILDFNKCYNPYCAYNEKYTCPIVPEINHLNIEIKAGVKKFKK